MFSPSKKLIATLIAVGFSAILIASESSAEELADEEETALADLESSDKFRNIANKIERLNADKARIYVEYTERRARSFHGLTRLEFSNLSQISNEAAKELARHRSWLFLNGLTSLSDEAAAVLRQKRDVRLPVKFQGEEDESAPANAETSTATAGESPRAVVARWLELHRTGKRDEPSALTTGAIDHRAQYLLPSKRDTGVRVKRSLGNQQAAAVITNALKKGREEVLLFWLVRRDGTWRINKSDLVERRVVDERLRGFLEAGDVRWHLQRDEVVGRWQAGPCTPPGLGGVACGSRLELGDDNRYRLVAWGPAGPPEGDDADHVMQGRWRVADGCILLSHGNRCYECRVAWMADNLLVIKSADGKVRAKYERTVVLQLGDGGEAKKK